MKDTEARRGLVMAIIGLGAIICLIAGVLSYRIDNLKGNPCQAHFALAQLASGERVCVLLPEVEGQR